MMASAASQPQPTCVVCNAVFASRNKLYKHLQESGHTSEAAARASQPMAAGGADHDRLDNPSFHSYYLQQRICHQPQQWQTAYDQFKRELPLAVRVSFASPAGSFLAALLALHAEVSPIGWYPDGGGEGGSGEGGGGAPGSGEGGGGGAGPGAFIDKLDAQRPLGAMLLAAAQVAGSNRQKRLELFVGLWQHCLCTG